MMRKNIYTGSRGVRRRLMDGLEDIDYAYDVYQLSEQTKENIKKKLKCIKEYAKKIRSQNK